MNWQLQEAKNKLSQLLRKAQEQGPQTITVHGKKTAVVMSFDEYQKFNTHKQLSLLDFMQASPWAGLELDTSRDKDTGRDVQL